ncbi:hypothetical protein ACLOJK_008607 [Asimina triloba]
MRMKVSSADSAYGRVKGGIIQGEIVQLKYGFQPEESIESYMANTVGNKKYTHIKIDPTLFLQRILHSETERGREEPSVDESKKSSAL